MPGNEKGRRPESVGPQDQMSRHTDCGSVAPIGISARVP